MSQGGKQQSQEGTGRVNPHVARVGAAPRAFKMQVEQAEPSGLGFRGLLLLFSPPGGKKNGVGKRRCSSGREVLGRGPSFAGVLGGGRFAAAPSRKSSSSFPAHPAPGMVPAREGARLGARTWRDLVTKEIGCQLMPVYKDICHPELGTSGEEVRARTRTAACFLFFFL